MIEEAPILTSVPEFLYRVPQGSRVQLWCEAKGTPETNIKWLRFGRVISFDSIYTINNITGDDGGIYECVARNIKGRAAKEIKIITIGAIPTNSELENERFVRDSDCVLIWIISI